MCLNTQLRRKEAADCLRNVFGSTQQVWFDLLQDSVYSVALAPSGDIASVCVFVKVTEPDASTWGRITHLGTHGDYQNQGYARAAMACALRYFREHTTHADFGLMADTYSSTPASKRIQANRSAVTYYEKVMGMAVSSALGAVSQVHEDGELTQQYMEGNIAAVLEKIGETCIRTQVVDALSYDAIRCKISEGGERKFQLHYTYETYGWTNISDVDVFSGLHIDGSGDIGGIDWATVEPALRKCGISRANVKDAMQKGKNQKVTLCAGARSPGQSSELQQRDIPEAYRQLDELETDDLCLVKAAAGGLHFCGRPNTAQKLLQTFPVGRVKMTMMTNFLQDKGVQAKKLPGRDRYGEDVLKTVMDAARAQKPNRYLAEIVDGNGLAGHAVFIDLQAGVIIDPANKNTVPFDQSQLDKCAGPYSMCWGLRHVRQLTIGVGGGKRKHKKKRPGSSHKKKKSGSSEMDDCVEVTDVKKEAEAVKYSQQSEYAKQAYDMRRSGAEGKHDRAVFREIFQPQRGYSKKSYLTDTGSVTLNFDVPEGAVVLDCGAHVGFFALYALQQGAAKVICVEPHPGTFDRLQENLAQYVKQGRVILHKGAVVIPADHSKQLFITDKGYRSKVGTEGADKFEVEAKFLLTDLLNPTSGDTPTFVKVDIEGGEIPVLTDDTVDWNQVTHLVFEYTRSAVDSAGHTRSEEIQRVLHAKNFSTHSWVPSAFTPHHTEQHDSILHCIRDPITAQILEFCDSLTILRDHRASRPGSQWADEHKAGNKKKSIVFGAKNVVQQSGNCITDDTRTHHEGVHKVLDWAKTKLCKGFTFSSFIVLKNTDCHVHGDFPNVGTSAIITIGKHSGGELCVLDGDGGKVLHCHNTVHYFDPRVCHTTMPWWGEDGGKFGGTRYSFVFYTSGQAQRLYETGWENSLSDLQNFGFFALPTQSDVVVPGVPMNERGRREAAANAEYEQLMRTRAGMSRAEQWKLRRGVNLV